MLTFFISDISDGHESSSWEFSSHHELVYRLDRQLLLQFYAYLESIRCLFMELSLVIFIYIYCSYIVMKLTIEMTTYGF